MAFKNLTSAPHPKNTHKILFARQMKQYPTT